MKTTNTLSRRSFIRRVAPVVVAPALALEALEQAHGRGFVGWTPSLEQRHRITDTRVYGSLEAVYEDPLLGHQSAIFTFPDTDVTNSVFVVQDVKWKAGRLVATVRTQP